MDILCSLHEGDNFYPAIVALQQLKLEKTFSAYESDFYEHDTADIHGFIALGIRFNICVANRRDWCCVADHIPWSEAGIPKKKWIDEIKLEEILENYEDDPECTCTEKDFCLLCGGIFLEDEISNIKCEGVFDSFKDNYIMEVTYKYVESWEDGKKIFESCVSKCSLCDKCLWIGELLRDNGHAKLYKCKVDVFE